MSPTDRRPESVSTRPDYAEFHAAFSARDIAQTLAGDLETGINVCVECCDAHAHGDAVALAWEGARGERLTLTFADLKDRAARFANVLVAHGVKPGDVVAGMLPRCPELLVTILATWRVGGVYQPLFTAFGPKAIEHRLQTSGANFVVTDPTNRPKLDDVAVKPVIAVVARAERGESVAAGDLDFVAALAAAKPTFAPVLRKGTDAFLMMSTSGTTGLPKGVPVPIRALLGFRVYMEHAVDLRPGDVFWNIADPGWAYGLYYAVTGPLMMGHATTFYEGGFTAESTYRIIRELGVTNLAGSPTAYRLLMAAGDEAAASIKGQLRVVSSAGEPLNPEVIRWFDGALAAPIADHYGQTELGMVVNNHHGLAHDIRAGSAGFSMPGHRVRVIDIDGTELPPNMPGELAVDVTASPLFWFGGYLNQETPSLLRRPQRRRHHLVGLSHRSLRRRERADRAPGGDRGGGGRQAGPGAHRDRQGLRRAEAGSDRLGRTRRGTARPRPQAPVGACLSARDPVHGAAAEDAVRQAPALRAPRDGQAGGVR